MASASRRSERVRKSEINKITSSSGQSTPRNGTSKRSNKTSKKINEDSEHELENIEVNKEKPTELFNENDIHGGKMYNLCSPKKNSMSKKVEETRHQNNTATPDSKKEPYVCLSKCDIKSKSKKKEEESVQENKVEINVSPPRLRSRTKATKDYNLQTEEYFAKQSEKSITSNHTLSKLKHRHIDEEKLQELLAKNVHISKPHQEAIKHLSKLLEPRYEEWLHIMEEGFTVLLYGLGSKRLLINNFFKKIIPNEPTLIINGFFPSLTIKEILDNILVELMGLEAVASQSECFDIIEKELKSCPEDRIYLLIHNLDGGMLRSSKAQDVLSRLASIPNVHVLASVDHINAPLIWDNAKRAKYNFYWMDATTFLPYEAETSYESSLLVQKSGALALLSLQNVFASLTQKTKDLYILLAKYQLANNGSNYNGMPFKDLYNACREAFVVSSDQALRTQLTEFIDHKLVKTKRIIDGVEYLIIPMDDALLKQFLEQNESI